MVRTLFAVIALLVLSITLYADGNQLPLHKAQDSFKQSKLLYENALKEYKKALEIDPASELAHFGLAELYQYKGTLDEAIAEYEKVIEINPDNMLANYRLGKAYLERGWPIEKAIKMFERAISLSKTEALKDSNLEDLYYNLGEAYYESGRYNKAIEAYKNAIATNDQHYEAHYSLGICYYEEMNLPDVAVTEFQKAISIYPEHEDSHFYLGLIYYYKKQLDEAILEFKKAGDYVATYHWLGYIYEEKNQLIQAINEYKKAIQLEPEDAEIRYLLAKIYYGEKKYELAINELKEAMQSEPSEKDYYYLLAECYRKLNDMKSARAILKRVLSYSPKKLIIFIFFTLLPSMIIFVFGKRLLRNLSDQIQERIRQVHKFRRNSGKLFIFGLFLLVALYSILHIEYLIKAYGIPYYAFFLVTLFFLYLSVNIVFFYFDRIIRQTSLGIKSYFKFLFFNFIDGIFIFVVYYTILAISCLLPEHISQTINSAKFAPILLGLIWFICFAFSAYFIMLFFKTHSLQSQDLRKRLINLCKRLQVEYRDILVFETSGMKLASAMASGLWPRFRYLFISSYLIETCTPTEIETIFMHELGHYKKGHIRKQFLSLLFFLLLILIIAFALSDYPDQRTINYFLINWLPIIVFLFWFKFIRSIISRSHEKQADEYVVDNCDHPQDFISALRKLHLINYIPEKWGRSEKIFITHPSLEKRIDYIKKRIEEKEKR